MGLKSKGKQVSFEILTSPDATALLMDRFNSDPLPISDHNQSNGIIIDDDDDDDNEKRNRRRIRNQKKKSKRKKSSPMNTIDEIEFRVSEESSTSHSYSTTITTTNTTVCEESESGSQVFNFSQGELRQRNVSCGGGSSGGITMAVSSEETAEKVKEKEKEKEKEEVANSRQMNGNGEINGRKLEKKESLDWRQLITDDPSGIRPFYTNFTKYC